jgi:hypothetical protein
VSDNVTADHADTHGSKEVIKQTAVAGDIAINCAASAEPILLLPFRESGAQ